MTHRIATTAPSGPLLDFPSPAFHGHYHQPTGQVYIKTVDAIYSLNPGIPVPMMTLKKRTDERFDGFDLSVNGRSAYSLVEGIVYRIDVETLEILDSFSITTDWPIFKFFACDSGRVLIVRDIQPDLHPDIMPIELVDMDKKEIVRRYHYPTNGYPDGPRSCNASESGGYMTIGSHIYRVGENYLRAIGKSYFYGRFSVGRDGQEFALSSDNDRIEIRSLPELTTVQTINVNTGASYPSLDPATGLLGCCVQHNQGYQFIIYDPQSEQIRFRQHIALASLESVQFINNMLLSPRSGYGLPINMP
jgi:hypothetical protein